MDTSVASLSGRTAVVIGGTSGIGRVLALGLATAGADVVASSRRAEQVEATAREIESLARRTLRIACDVCDRASLENLLAKTIESFGKVDILVNCAGKIERGPSLDIPEESWRDILETNLTGTLRGCQIFGRHMLERGYGRIINLASLNTFVSLTQVAAYADAHLVVHSAKGDSGVRPVTGDDRVAELARMLAGLGESDSGRAHARELLDAAQNDEI